MISIKQIIIILTVVLAFISCKNPAKVLEDTFNKTPEIDAFTRAVKVSLPLAYAANCAMDAANKVAVPGVTVVGNFDTFPCNAMLHIAVSNTHRLPLGKDSTGSILVVGHWSDTANAIMSIFFTKCDIADGSFTLSNVALVPVVRDTSGTMVIFASEDINQDSGSTASMIITDSMITFKQHMVPDSLSADSAVCVNQKAWITLVKKQQGGAIGNEKYILYGASQHIGVSTVSAEVVQSVMLAVTMQPSICRANPASGFSLIRTIKVSNTYPSGTELGTTVLSFNATCNGMGKILLATGVYLGKTGTSMALNLDQ